MIRRWRWSSLVGLLITLTMMALSYQNCGRFGTLEIQESNFSSLLSISDCLKQSNFDACIFNKNPWNHEKAEGTSTLRMQDPTAIPALQDLGIQLPADFKNGKVLDTARAKINSKFKKEFNGNLKVPYSLQTQSAIHHLMAYHWSKRAMEDWQISATQNLFDNKNLTIETDAGITGWSSEKKTLYLKLDAGAKSHAIDASSIVHLLTEAAIDFSTGGKIYNVTDISKFYSCGSPGEPVYHQDCCSSLRGCSSAVTAGLSDYMVSQVFQNAPAVAEGISANPLGMQICTVHRNPILNVDLTANAAFEACRSEGRPGQIFVMGAFYASLWHSVQKAAVQSGISAAEFQEFLQSLVAQLDGNDDFLTVFEKIKSTDMNPKFNGRFTPLFEAEHKRRGL